MKYVLLVIIGLIILSGVIYADVQSRAGKGVAAVVSPSPVATATPSPSVKPTTRPSVAPSVKQQGEDTTPTVRSELPVLNSKQILALVNQYRQANGKPLWGESAELCRLAEQRAEYVIQPSYEEFLANTYPSFKNHPGFQEMAANFNYSGIGLSENLALGAKSDNEVLTIWKNSPSHNMLLLATDHNETTYTKACVATRVKYYGSISVLLAGDK